MKEFIIDYIFISLLAFLISVIVTPLVRKSCQQKHVLDFPTEPRKIHTVPLPRLGGIAIYLAFFLPLFTVLLSEGPPHELFLQHLDTLFNLFVASTLVFALGVYDDIWGATVSQKLFFQVIAAILIYFLGFEVHVISIPLLGSVPLGMFSLPVTILWIIGVTNAINFIDGIDGLACGVGFFSVSTMFILSLFLDHPMTAFFAAALAGGLFGFALYNFAPASIFMGDSGSLFTGFVIAAISLHGSQKSSTAVVLLIPIVALGVPITDTLLAIVRRLANGYSPFMADKDHIHHRLLRMGFSSRQVVLGLYLICSLLGVIALLMTAVTNQVLTLILIMLSVLTIGGMKFLGYTTDMRAINTLAKQRSHQKKRWIQRKKQAANLLEDLTQASDLKRLEQLLLQYVDLMEFDLAHLEIYIEPPVEFQWYSPRYRREEIPNDQIWTLTMPIQTAQHLIGTLRAGTYLHTRESFLETAMCLERLKEALEQGLAAFSIQNNQAVSTQAER